MILYTDLIIGFYKVDNSCKKTALFACFAKVGKIVK